MAKTTKKTKSATAAPMNKSAAIREYLASHPDAGPTAVAAALKEKGIDVKPGLVGLVKYQANKPAGKKAGRRPGRRAGSRRAVRAPRAVRAARGSGNKSDAVRQYLAANPTASPAKVKDALAAKGIKISASLASVIKYSKPGKKAGRPRGRGRGPGRPARAMARLMNGELSLEALMDAKRFADGVGGIDRAKRLLEALEQIA